MQERTPQEEPSQEAMPQEEILLEGTSDEIVDEGTEEHGDHSDYPHEPRLRDLPFTLWNLPRWALLLLIRGYQMSLSKTLPPNTCRFYPTCSHYGYQAIYKYGALKGGLMAAWRVLRCNPFVPGGYDPVP